MTPAERQRRSRAGGKLRGKHPSKARRAGGSPHFYRNLAYVREHGVPEWDQLLDDGQGHLVIGASTQRQMVKLLSPHDQLDMIEIAKQDRKKALRIWKEINDVDEAELSRRAESLVEGAT